MKHYTVYAYVGTEVTTYLTTGTSEDDAVRNAHNAWGIDPMALVVVVEA